MKEQKERKTAGTLASVTGPTIAVSNITAPTTSRRQLNWKHYLLTAGSIAVGIAAGNDLIQQGKIICAYIKEVAAHPESIQMDSFHRFAAYAVPEQYYLSILYGLPIVAFYSFIIVYGIIEIIRSTKETEEKEYEAEKARIIEATDRECGLIK